MMRTVIIQRKRLDDRAKDVVRGMRNLRTDMEVPPSQARQRSSSHRMMRQSGIFTEITESYQTLAGASEVCVQAGTEGVPEDAVSVVIPDAVMYIPLEDLVDFEKEKERLNQGKRKTGKGNLREARACFPMRSS